jgi:PPK2 family polyphosphate:nucleotide phosphotransferase
MKPGELKRGIQRMGEELSRIQDTMYAHDRYGVLVCLQGMDTAGKDSLIREVFSKFNPRGVVVHSFKQPTSKELEHDYLWRHWIALPEKGKFAVFNRSHYENVLVTRVNPELIVKEKHPGINAVSDIPVDFWSKRISQINDFERIITENGTIVLKFYLHLSKEEQRQRLLRRLNRQEHQWKFSPGDMTERTRWDTYMRHYEEAIVQTNKNHAPWYIIPADDKDTARYLVASVLLKTMQGYTDIKEPKISEEVLANLKTYKKALQKGAI